MFRGNHPAKVDEKGRLKMPSAFKQLMDAGHVTQFYVTSTNGKVAEMPKDEAMTSRFVSFAFVLAISLMFESSIASGSSVKTAVPCARGKSS